MKKVIMLSTIIVIIIVTLVGYKYISYKNHCKEIQKENSEFDKYKDREVYGLDVASLINMAIDKNTKNKIEKDDSGNFITNEENSIEIEIHMSDNDITYKMESINNAGIERFLQYYKDIKFKCSKIEYHKNTGRIKYILFEQQKNS